MKSQQLKKLIDPFDNKNVNGIVYTFTLSDRVKKLKKKKFLNSRETPEFVESKIGEKGYELKPGEFAVFYTKEKVTLNNKYICLLSTRPTIAQMGLDVCQSSSLCEPDTDNTFALEIANHGQFPVHLFPGVKIVKGIFIKV